MSKKKIILLGFFLFTLILAKSPSINVKEREFTSKLINEKSVDSLKTSEWESGFNYSIIDNFPYFWIEINETGTNITSNFQNLDDDDTGIFFSGQGWNFTFYGTEYDTFNVSTNGFLSFGRQGDMSNNYAYPIPQDCTQGSREFHNDTVFLFDADLRLDPGGSVFYEFKGTAPNRYLVVEYIQIYNFSSPVGPQLVGDFEAIFYENGDIKFQYKLVKHLIWDSQTSPQHPVVGLDHGDLINYSNYTNNWTKTFGFNDVKELAVYFRLSRSSQIFFSLGDDDDDDDEEAIIPFGNYYLLFAVIAMLSLIVIMKRKAIFKE